MESSGAAFRRADRPPELERLGAPIDHFGASSLVAVRLFFVAPFFLFAGLGFLALAAVVARVDPVLAFALGGVFGVPVTALGAWHAVSAFRERRVRVELHERGVVHRAGSTTTAMLWDDVELVRTSWLRLLAGPGAAHVLVTADGRRVLIPRSLVRADALTAAIEQQTVARMLPRVVRAIEDGAPAVFGPFVATRDALSFRRKELRWSEIARVDARAGFLVVTARTGYGLAWARAPLRAVPNHAVLTALARSRLTRRSVEWLRARDVP